MSLLFKIIFVSRCTSTHHKLAMDALRLLRHPLSDDWRKLFLKSFPRFLEGAKAPDDVFKDFRNHVLHVREHYWGGALDAARLWYDRSVEAFRKRDWDEAVYSAGVLSHYVTDPFQPFHTGQTEAEGVVHRAAEWSINKCYSELQNIIQTDLGGYPEIPVSHSPNWLSDLVRKGAEKGNTHYEACIEHYDIQRGVADPIMGLDQEMKDRCAEMIAAAVASLARVFDQMLTDAEVDPPAVDLSLETLIQAINLPMHMIVNKLNESSARMEVAAIYEEFLSQGKVIGALPEDEKTVRKLHAEEVLRVPLEKLDAEKPRAPGTRFGRGAAIRFRSTVPQFRVSPPRRSSASSSTAMGGAVTDLPGSEASGLTPGSRDSIQQIASRLRDERASSLRTGNVDTSSRAGVIKTTALANSSSRLVVMSSDQHRDISMPAVRNHRRSRSASGVRDPQQRSVRSLPNQQAGRSSTQIETENVYERRPAAPVSSSRPDVSRTIRPESTRTAADPFEHDATESMRRVRPQGILGKQTFTGISIPQSGHSQPGVPQTGTPQSKNQQSGVPRPRTESKTPPVAGGFGANKPVFTFDVSSDGIVPHTEQIERDSQNRGPVSEQSQQPISSQFFPRDPGRSGNESESSRDSSTSDERLARYYLSRNSPVADGPSVGPKTAAKLAPCGIHTVNDLLTANPEKLADKLNLRWLNSRMIREWQQQAELVCRIPGLRGHDAQLLVGVGITDPDEIAARSPRDIQSLILPFARTPAGMRILRQSPPPDVAEIDGWIRNAAVARPLRAA